MLSVPLGSASNAPAALASSISIGMWVAGAVSPWRASIALMSAGDLS